MPLKKMIKIGASIALVVLLTPFPIRGAVIDQRPIYSTPHRIECWNSRGELTRTYENEIRSPYFHNADHVMFMEKKSQMMMRMTNSCSMVEWWNPKDGN